MIHVLILGQHYRVQHTLVYLKVFQQPADSPITLGLQPYQGNINDLRNVQYSPLA